MAAWLGGWFDGYAAAYPMAPLGGLFILPVSLCILAGTAAPRLRMSLVGLGFALGTAALVLLGGRLARHLHAPSTVQVGSLVLAILLEFAGFAVVMPRLADRRGRAAVVATLVIVSGHFLIMTPAFGPVIAVLGLLGLLNAGAGWRWPGIGAGWLWLTDGTLKLCGAAALIAAAPALTGGG